MHALVAFVPALGCGLMMLVCVGLVRLPRRGGTPPSAESEEIASLRAEVAALREEKARE